MRIPVHFELWDKPLCNSDYLCTEDEISGKFIAIKFNKKVYSMANKASNDCKNATRESLKKAVDYAIKNKREAGMFFIYLDKGVFDLAD